jgi:outer membrane receptor protein involved in Fe transport
MHIALLMSLLAVLPVFTQTKYSFINGIVKDAQGKPLEGINIFVKEINKVFFTNENGLFVVDNLIANEYALVFSGIGYATKTTKIKLSSKEKKSLTIFLSQETITIDEVIVKGKNKTNQIEASSLSVKSIKINKVKSTTTDVSQVLKGLSGIRIRETGGLGSTYSFSLNGLSDYRVRFFVDDIPVDYLGEAYKLNNLPVNIIDRVNIYKGVVPVNLGADALGGAVNIITSKSKNSYVDASYSFGSFNTNRFTLNSQYRDQKSGFTIRPKLIYNYSDNNYTMYNQEVFVDGILQIRDVSRFHDGYSSITGSLEAGYTDVDWADELLVSHSVTSVKKDLQTDIYGNPLGEVRSEEDGNITTLKYRKNNLLNKKIDLKLFAVYNTLTNKSIDSSSNRYNWLGEIKRVANDNTAELNNQKTIFEYNQKTFIYRTNVKYDISENHAITLNYVGLNIKREGENRLGVSGDEPFKSPNTLDKNVIGVSYDSHYFDRKLNFNASLKYYDFKIFTRNAKYLISNNTTVIEDIKTNENKLGYSFAARYFITPKLFVKTSFEKGYRLPEPMEIFGNGVSVDANPELKPEESENLNFSVHNTLNFNKNKLRTSVNFFRRDVLNFTQIIPSAKRSKYENIRDVLIYGFELDFKYNYNNRLFVDANFTRQYSLNNVKLNDRGDLNRAYKEQLPNTPFLFSNLAIAYDLFENPKKYKATVDFNLNYVKEFYLGYSFTATAFNKNTIPNQLTNDLGITISTINEKYSVSIQATNIFNQRVFDNFNIQKPGRAIFAKIRYNFNK